MNATNGARKDTMMTSIAAQKIVEIGGIVFADVVLREGVHHRGQLFGRRVGEGGAADGGGAVAREGGAFHENRAEVGDFVRGRLCGRMRTDENGREECGRSSYVHCTMLNDCRRRPVHMACGIGRSVPETEGEGDAGGGGNG